MRNLPMSFLGIKMFHTSVRQLQAQSLGIKLSSPLALGATFLPSKYRMAYTPLYESPLSKPIATLKRVSFAFGLVGLYLSNMMYTSPALSSDLSYVLATCSVLPLPLIEYFTRDYVSRIFRVYNTEKDQSLENLTTDEILVAEKISLTGRSFYNTILKPAELQLTDGRFGWVNWKTKNGSFYVNEDIGGINMDRLWGMAEHNSGIDNGRYFGK